MEYNEEQALQDTIGELETEISNLEDRLEDTKDDLRIKEDELYDAAQDLEKTESMLSDANEELSAAYVKIETLEQEIEELLSQLADAEDLMHFMVDDERRKYQDRMAELENKLLVFEREHNGSNPD